MTERRSLNQHLRPWVLGGLVLYWTALFISTHTPMPDTPDFPHNIDKVAHFVAYAGLAFLLGLWFAVTRPISFRDYVVVFGVTVVYSIADELLQAIPFLHRTADPWDVLADWVGSAIGLVLLAGFLAVARGIENRRTTGEPDSADDQPSS